MIKDYIQRPETEEKLKTKLISYRERAANWSNMKTVFVVKGLAGSGKTTFILDYFKNKPVFYFSFARLSDKSAEKVFTHYVTEKTNNAVSSWKDGFTTVSKLYKYIFFDDISSVLSSEPFRKAFYDYMITDIYNCPFVVLIAQPTDDITELADNYKTIDFDYFSIPEVLKIYPKLPKADIFGLCAVSGGIPKIFKEYDSTKSFGDNLLNFFSPSSAFVNFMPDMLSRYFRKPESYHYILCAIANGNNSISEIGKFTGFAYNKCDNYISALVAYGFVKTEKAKSKRGAEKTVYVLTNNYFKLWYLYIYMNRTEIQLENRAFINSIVKSITEIEIHAFHLKKAFLFAKILIRGEWESLRRGEDIVYNPQTISDGDFYYTFDAIINDKNGTIFIKVFETPAESCTKDELEKLRRAVMLVNTYYDSHIYIFTKKRFSDYAVSEAHKDDSIHLVEVERLKY